jgi:hypothetical protein
MGPALDTRAEFDAQLVRCALERSAAELEAPVLAQLRDARMLAMGRFEARRSVPAFAWAHVGQRAHNTYYRTAAALFCAVLLLGGTAWWQQQVAEHDDSDTDIAILTDDLPMDVYVE